MPTPAESRFNQDRVAALSAILTALPDLMFVILRDGTYVDYHARDPNSLFAAPDRFIGRTVRDVMPPALAEVFMRALEQTAFGDDPVVVEYELPSDDPHSYEARIVRMGADRCLSIVRDITALKRAAKLNHDLARRLISSQEAERQRIARELHDDISQRLAALKIEIDRLAAETGSERSPARLRELSALASEIAGDVHRMSYELHPSKLQLIGLVAALKSLCGDVSKQRNLDVVFTQADMPPAVDADVSLCVYRIVQEALHNVARHSRARGAQVSVKGEQAHIVLEITDAGDGFDPAQVSPTGLGLIGMHERVAGLNGRLTIDTAPGRGTRITARIPHAR